MDTYRPTSEGAEGLINNPLYIFDHGFVYLVDYMGNDQSIVDAARRSLKPGEQKNLSSPENLIRYLIRNKHTSPIEMIEMKFHLKMPIFVARQWMRHRMASINELSGRYSKLEAEFYVPALEDIHYQSTDNHQGRGEQAQRGHAIMAYNWIKLDASTAFSHYDKMVNEFNLAKEVARVNVPVATYTEFYWKIDLHNLMHFLRLRLDDHSQFEIREYAEVVASIVETGWPIAYKAFEDYSLNALTFSGPELKILKHYIGELKSEFWPKDHGLSKREQKEFLAKLDRIMDK